MFERGTVVKSAAGKDKGSLLVVVGSDKGKVYLCDGKTRPLERAKSKNIRHIECTPFILNDGMMTTNRQLRRALNELARAQGR